MVQKLEQLKDKIIRGTTCEQDIDTINEVIDYLQSLEEKIEMQPEPALLETREEMFPAGLIIENATIYIDRTKETK